MNFQGCVYCLILNYQGSLLCRLKQPSYYIKLILSCQQLFKLFLSFSELFIALLEQLRQFIMSFLSCQELFSKQEAEKEGFEPSRRLPDLHP